VADTLSPVLQGALAADRERLNALFAAARRGGGLDAAEFAAWIREGIAPAVDAAAALHPESAGPVLEALFARSLDLVAQRVLGAGARAPEVAEGWRRVLPALPGLLAADPEGLSAAVVNALHRLAATEGARPDEWTAAMLRVGPRCPDLPSFRDAGLLAAWRAGLAQYRDEALALARGMEPGRARAALGLEDAGPAALASLLEGVAADPWRSLEEVREGPWGEPRLALVGRVGAFSGFGGQFPLPPLVEARQGALYARSDGRWWRLFADCYGAAFHRVEAPAPPSREAELRQDEGPSVVAAAGLVRHRRLTATFAELTGVTSFASDGVTLAVTIATSHAVYLVARR
jgi:hypothetical protein